ncbi:MAG: hypothetical protein M1838_002666 [Thelocarpon superellum]|nr:MAG: hypothetical protein M1838_002666 [Thelocarpon superellum]
MTDETPLISARIAAASTSATPEGIVIPLSTLLGSLIATPATTSSASVFSAPVPVAAPEKPTAASIYSPPSESLSSSSSSSSSSPAFSTPTSESASSASSETPSTTSSAGAGAVVVTTASSGEISTPSASDGHTASTSGTPLAASDSSAPSAAALPTSSSAGVPPSTPTSNHTALIAALAAVFGSIALLGVVTFVLWRWRRKKTNDGTGSAVDDDEIETWRGSTTVRGSGQSEMRIGSFAEIKAGTAANRRIESFQRASTTPRHSPILINVARPPSSEGSASNHSEPGLQGLTPTPQRSISNLSSTTPLRKAGALADGTGQLATSASSSPPRTDSEGTGEGNVDGHEEGEGDESRPRTAHTMSRDLGSEFDFGTPAVETGH